MKETVVRCPTCRREIRWEGNSHRPFCSERCKLMDFGNWMSERYRVPAEDASPPESSQEPEE